MTRILLIHGACHDQWCWHATLPLLAAGGHDVVALDMPGRGGDGRDPATLTLADQAQVILDAAGDGALLVGHSAGGFSISAAAAAAPEKVQGLVYVAALLPQEGDTLVGKMQGLSATERPRFRRAGDGAYIFDTEGAAHFLYNGVDPALAEEAVGHIVPEPSAPHGESIRLSPDFADIPKTYIRCTEDRVIPSDDQARMARDGSAEMHDMTTGHSPFLSDPRGLAALILRAAEGL
ncbi:alpha/beta fold hydrolase [Pseudooceanicola sp. LIPI14-2-Ac024]|uniref:alpha/beta fold hydrolase n=1 Tax=Pseudooceanicola sp. LIPI14-2-Ac024 TaxID=3344875 RepID=UPI0035D05C52